MSRLDTISLALLGLGLLAAANSPAFRAPPGLTVVFEEPATSALDPDMTIYPSGIPPQFEAWAVGRLAEQKAGRLSAKRRTARNAAR